MGSLAAMSSRGKKSHSEDRYFQAEAASDDRINADAGVIDVLQNVSGRWEPLATADEGRPVVAVPVGEHGTVTLDLAAVLR